MDKIGPYFIGSPEKGLTLDKINAMPPKQKSVHLQSIQTINLHSAALEDSLNDEETGALLVRHNGEYVSIDNILDLGLSLPTNEKLKLVEEVMNQNIIYTPPEIDPFVTRRTSAPRQDLGDYAQTTRETFTSGIGDCEDWAIAQADLLARMGVPLSHLHVMSGTVYNAKENIEFDHANLAVKNDSGQWDVMELGQGKIFIAPKDYLDTGIEGYVFIPNISVRADGNINQFKLNNSEYSLESSGFGSASEKTITAGCNLSEEFGCATSLKIPNNSLNPPPPPNQKPQVPNVNLPQDPSGP